MALTTRSISDILTRIRYTLQDASGTRWTDEEMYVYIDDAMRDIALRTFYRRISQDISINTTDTLYYLDYEAIKIHSIASAQQITIEDATTLSIESPSAENITVEYYAYPDRVTYGSTTVLTLEEDMYNLVIWFVLSKCYEKEDSTELLAKSGYFMQRYMDYISLNMTRWHGELDPVLAKSDFYFTSATNPSDPLSL